MPSLQTAQLGMDSEMDAGATEPMSSESTVLTAYPQGTTNDVAPQSAFTSSLDTDTWTSSSHLGSQSRSNLRQASLALDTAYERITSLRNSINNMLNRIPPEAPGTGTSTSTTEAATTQPYHSLSSDTSIGPPHSALVLSGEQVVEELNSRAARLRSLISPSARQRLEEFESGSRNSMREEFSWDRFTQNDRSGLDRTDVRPTPTRPRTPPMPDLVIPRVRDHVDPRASAAA
ncbi:hypothetical protein JVU11DRAFT_5477 [Chiua virens]|nr:hypothetical protein JVU11DRAFT_5477 [Chiua virens]